MLRPLLGLPHFKLRMPEAIVQLRQLKLRTLAVLSQRWQMCVCVRWAGVFTISDTWETTLPT
eukprot:1508768-Alexandrium_andersonii.AAC.1